jgi:hypothetical protein
VEPVDTMRRHLAKGGFPRLRADAILWASRAEAPTVFPFSIGGRRFDG